MMKGDPKNIFGMLLALHVALILLQGFFPLLAFCQTNVTSLPGFNGTLPFDLETGYVGVGESESVQLFYYFVRSEGNPKDDPLIFWLMGGPGCSGFSALVYELGPVQFNLEYEGGLPTLVLNPYSWTKAASIIYIDSPVGTGFSYSTSKSVDDSFASDTIVRVQLYEFLRKWLLGHPEFLSNSVYVGGESYSGMITSPVMQDISDGNEAGNVPFINIKGYLLGNTFTDRNRDKNERVPYAHRMGLISDELYESLKESCGGEYVNVDPTNAACLKNLETYLQCVGKIGTFHILDPYCDFASLQTKEIELYRRSLGENFKESADLKSPLTLESEASYPHCKEYDHLLSSYWENDNRVQMALNVTKGSVSNWKRCDRERQYQYEIESTFPNLVVLSKRGYRSLVFSGDHDPIVPFSATQEWIRDLNYSIIDDWRPWFVDGQVGGYTRTYSNKMTFATVKGAGHTPPEYKHKECFEMFKRWISSEPL